MLKLYNTLTRKKETFKPIKKEEVGMYNCGPTVYWYPHIGNFRTYIFSDVLMRVLAFNGYKVKQVINVTDVGHLTSDSDSGEDKVEKAAAKEGKNAKEITNFYWNAFKTDMKKLNILEPTIWSKATEHIKEQIALIKKLEEKGYTYKTEDGIYFDTSKFKNYGKMAGLKKENIIAGKRVDMKDKKNNTDFALWKFSEEKGKRQQEWSSQWGVGYPGWHIECSAMSMKYLGEHFDLHTGGEDHIPIHHTNEIAQSEAATGKKFVNYWLHASFLTFKGEKVSKSKGGLYTIQELEDLTYKPLSYRYLCLNSHYRSQMDFSLENLENAQNSYKRLKNIIEGLIDDKKINKEYLDEFEKAINDDLNMPEALQVLWKLVRDEKAEGKLETIKKMDEVLGLKLLEKEKIEIPKEIKEIAEERQQARENKNWKKSDELREKIKSLGWEVADTKDGYAIKKV
jgi:cysteinyl-tRNA synthetase